MLPFGKQQEIFDLPFDDKSRGYGENASVPLARSLLAKRQSGWGLSGGTRPRLRSYSRLKTRMIGLP
jgi:hypothetical protein